MATKDIIEQYVIELKPQMDTQAYKSVTKKLRNSINKQVRYNNLISKQAKQENKDRQNTLKTIQATSKVAKASTTSISKALGAIPGKVGAIAGIITTAITLATKLMKNIVSSAKEFSNSMITASSSFVDKNTRSIMGTFGVSGVQASGISKSLSVMGLSTSDLQTMTPGQLKLFMQLIKTWSSGINSIDKDKLTYYSEMMQEFQSDIAIEKIKMQVQLQKLLVENAPQIKSILNTLTRIVENFIEQLGKPATQRALSNFLTLIDLIASLIEFVQNTINSIVNFFDDIGLGWLFSNDLTTGVLKSIVDGLNSTTESNTSGYSNYITIDASSSNTFNGDTNSMYALSSNLSENKNKTISTTLWKTGRV